MDKVKILVIDDKTDNILVLKALLTKAFPQAAFLSAASGRSGIGLCTTEKPDVVLLDIIMPVLDGYQVCQILKSNEHTKSIPVIMITAARTDKQSRIKALEFGADAFLAKPFDESELIAQIRAMLRIKESEDLKLDEKERLKRLVEERTQELQKELNERKLTEKALKESEERFYLLFNKAPLGYQSLDFDGCFIEVNQQWLETLGYKREEVIGKWFGEFLSPEYQDGFRQRFPILKSQGQIHSEFEMVHKDGSKIFVTYEGKVAYDLNGEFKQTYCILQDITEQNQSAKLLEESESQFRELWGATVEGIVILDKGIVIELNDAMCRMFGYKRQQVLGRSMLDFATAGMRDQISKRISSGKLGRFEASALRADGEQLTIEAFATDFTLQGKTVRLVSCRDITERKLAEKARKESYEFNQSLLKTIPFGMDIVDEEGTVLFQSENFETVFGKEALGHKCWELYRDDGQQCINCPLFRGIELGKTEMYESTGILGGRVFEIIHTGMMFKGKKAMLEIFMDITERKQAEENLKESRQLFRELFNASPDAIVLIDPHHLTVSWPIIDCNDAACKMNGYTHEEMIGQSIDLLNITDGSPEERIKYINMLRREGVFHTESFHRHKNGHIFPIEVSTSVITIGGHEMVLGIDRDITDRKKAEESLHKSEIRLKRAEIASKSGNWELLLDTQIMIGSEGAAKVYGLTEEQYNFDLIKKIPLPEYRPLLDAALKNLIEKDIPYDIEFKIRTFDTRKIKDIHSVAFYNKENRVLFGIIQDITDRKQAEINLKESEERYRGFISQVSEGVYRFECNQPIDISLPVEEQIDLIYDHMYIAECNQAILSMYKLSDEKEMIGKGPLDFHGERDNPVNRETFRTFIRNGYQVENAVTEELNAMGQTIFISNNSIGIIEDNKLVRMWGTQTDITEKMRSDQVQRVLFDISNAALSPITLPELIEFISKEVGKLLDSTNFYIAFYDEQTDMLSTIYEQDEKDVIDTWPASNSVTGWVIKQQKSLLIKDTEVQDFYDNTGIEQFGTPSKVWLGVPLVTDQKAIGALAVQSYDDPDAFTEKDKLMLEFISNQISVSIERKKTEQELKLMGKAFAQSPVTILITDKDGTIEYTNPKFSETTGYSAEEARGKNPKVLKSGHQTKEYYKNLWETILAGKDWIGEFQNKRKNGEIYWESAVISPITNENGEIGFFMAIKEDITEKKKMIADLIHARNKAEESDRLKSSFLANMSHEIRTPLNSIIGFSELLLDPGFGTEQHHEFVSIINASGNGLLTIISDIMDLSKIESGQVKVIRKKFSVTRLINDIQKEYSFKATDKGIELRFDPSNPNEEIYIESDEQKIRQVLINFVGNAIKFTEEGFIEIGFGYLQTDKLQCFVKDTGIGIPAEYHQQIFERFLQVESSNTRKYGGNGLGLAISKSLIEMLGGKIGLNSVQGEGSTFYFTLPLK